jgi:ketopantoate reductase
MAPYGKLEIQVFGEEEFTQKMMVSSTSEFDFKADVVIFTTQAQQTEGIVIELKEKLRSDSILITMQNGLSSGKILCYHFPSNPILQCSIWWSATLYSPTSVLYHRKAVSILGIPDCSMATQEDLASTRQLLAAVMETDHTINIGVEMKKKLILNTVSPILALVKKPYPEGLDDELVRGLIHILFDEALLSAIDAGWNIEDERLRAFHNIVAGREPVPNAPDRGKTPHKVSTQIGAEKHGGTGSNVSALLDPFIELGATNAKIIRNAILRLEPNYQAFTREQLIELRNLLSEISCPWSQ